MAIAEIITLPATEIGEHEAQLRGRIISTDSLAWTRFEYGGDSKYGLSTPWVTGVVDAIFSVVISGLTGNIHFRAVSRNNDGTSYGADMSFTVLHTRNTGSEFADLIYPLGIGG